MDVEETTYCADAASVSARSCAIPLYVFRAAPYSLEQLAAIEVRIESKNSLGYGPSSGYNTAGAALPQVTPLAYEPPADSSITQPMVTYSVGNPDVSWEDAAPVVVDDASYISEVTVCRASSFSNSISAVRFAFRSTDAAAAAYTGELQGYGASLCERTVAVTNATDCITKLTVAFDELGNGHTLIYKRLYGETLETVGYGDVSVDDLIADETPESGCLSGYQLGFAEPVAAAPTVGAGRAGRMLSDGVVSLQRVLTVSNEAIDNALFAAAAQVWAAFVAEQERIANLPRFCDVNPCYDDDETLTQE